MPKRYGGQLNIGRIVAVLAVGLAVIGGAIAMVVLLFGNRDIKLVSERLSLPAQADYRVRDGSISYVADNTLNLYDAESGKSRQLPLNAEIDGYAVRDDVVVVHDGGMVHIENAEAVTLIGTAREVRMGKDYVAVLRTGGQGSDSIVVFDYNAQVAGEVLDFSDSKVTNFGFYTDNGRELLWIISVETEQNTPVTTVKMFDYGAGGTISYLSPFYDQFVETLYFTDDSIFVVGTQDIVRYSITGGREKYRVGIYGNKVLDMTASEGTASFLLAPREDEPFYHLRLLRIAEADDALSSWRHITLTEPIVNAFLQGGYIKIVAEENVYIYTYAGRNPATLPLEGSAYEAYKLTDTYFVYFTEDGLYRAQTR
ncbi:MAG: hypothetical protein Q4C04_06725 [Clostridia bacterium]|nr:hypothetical protein [Clostridia bacterium]